MKLVKIIDNHNNNGVFANIEDAKLWATKLIKWGHEVNYTEFEANSTDLENAIEKWENAKFYNEMSSKIDFNINKQYNRYIKNLKNKAE